MQINIESVERAKVAGPDKTRHYDVATGQEFAQKYPCTNTASELLACSPNDNKKRKSHAIMSFTMAPYVKMAKVALASLPLPLLLLQLVRP